jgi:Putative zinc-finger
MSDHEHRCGDGKSPHLTCREIAEFLLGYLERDLDEQVLTEFDAHLNHCPPCEHYLEGYRETVELVRRCGKAECDGSNKPKWAAPPEDLIQAILRAKNSG